MEDLSKLAALVPAYQPQELLLDVVGELAQAGFNRVVVVDDGSRPDCQPLFEQLAQVPRVEVLHHPQNQGKGAALKTGLAHLLATGDEIGYLTVDADGQHRLADSLKLARTLLTYPEALVLGVRRFSGPGVPLRSRVGNILTRIVFFLLVGRFIRDTQTGLRAIPRSLAPRLLDIQANRYEYELEVLLECRKGPIWQVTIETVYLNDNQSSHFRPLQDSLKIYTTLLRCRFKTFWEALRGSRSKSAQL